MARAALIYPIWKLLRQLGARFVAFLSRHLKAGKFITQEDLEFWNSRFLSIFYFAYLLFWFNKETLSWNVNIFHGNSIFFDVFSLVFTPAFYDTHSISFKE